MPEAPLSSLGTDITHRVSGHPMKGSPFSPEPDDMGTQAGLRDSTPTPAPKDPVTAIFQAQ